MPDFAALSEVSVAVLSLLALIGFASIGILYLRNQSKQNVASNEMIPVILAMIEEGKQDRATIQGLIEESKQARQTSQSNTDAVVSEMRSYSERLCDLAQAVTRNNEVQANQARQWQQMWATMQAGVERLEGKTDQWHTQADQIIKDTIGVNMDKVDNTITALKTSIDNVSISIATLSEQMDRLGSQQKVHGESTDTQYAEIISCIRELAGMIERYIQTLSTPDTNPTQEADSNNLQDVSPLGG